MKLKTVSLTILLCTTSIASINAYSQDASNDRRERRGPPQEAIDVCIGKTSGDAVSFTLPNGNIVKSTCEIRHGQLVAAPPAGGHLRGKRDKPPQ
ncbi:Uncharacterised protein [BD1-7 clade bacterium]|uniref:Uncharacterized protein n=1 Tax=BD1-7 clade bacterium TaxID=2029982 RepID=A0A5S9Q027_9GAMM|nr:Uncharacterised protein [BD1-7 clade bacterium]CAA0110085.1 Uncharacterised protein [BD1-7 clade bacterium]